MIDSQPAQVPRAILSGGCWPSPLQTLLLRAALLEGSMALEAWKHWKKEEDFENLDAGSYRLLGLLYRNLMRIGADSDDPILPRLKGIYRHFWTRNQLVLKRKGTLLKALAQRGISCVLLKGAALTLATYRDFGVRPMEDFDLMVPFEKVLAVIDLLEESGWRSEVHSPRDLPESIHACSFRNAEGSCIDLHWRLCHLPASETFDRTFWQQVVPIVLQDASAAVPSLSDQFLHTCAHGPQYKAMSPVRWLADACCLYRQADGELDWRRIFSNAPSVGAVAGVRDTLGYLREHLEVVIPAAVRHAVSAIHVPLQERLENYTLSRPIPTPWHRMPLDFSHHMRCSRGRPWHQRLLGFKTYFRHANNLTPGQFTAHYKAQVLHWLLWHLCYFPLSLFDREDGSISRWPARDLSGFHLLEPFSHRALRWSKPHATLQLRFPPGRRFKIELDTGLLRDWKTDLIHHLHFVFNGLPIDPTSIEPDEGVLHIHLPEFKVAPAAGVRYPFSWVCEPLKSQGDSRLLGLPVLAVRIITTISKAFPTA